MKDGWSLLFVTLSGSALSGLTYLAFIEPGVYEIASLVLVWFIFAVIGFWSVFSFGTTLAIGRAREVIRAFSQADRNALSASNSLTLSDQAARRIRQMEMPGRLLFALIFLVGYLVALQAVPGLAKWATHHNAALAKGDARHPKSGTP